MYARNFINEQSQEQVLLGIVTSEAFNEANFRKALKDGFRLTASVAYLASLRGKEWLKSCIVAKHFSLDAVQLCNVLINSDLEDFYTLCIEGECGENTNYHMAYCIDKDKTLNYLKDKGLWDDILSTTMAAGDFHRSRVIGDTKIYLWIHENAPQAWLKERNL